ncbi:MAG: hypothetical protein ACRBF0_18790 [Calditrichia bacterium]
MKATFFYGLFMDEALLRDKGCHPTKPIRGYAGGYGLRIGERATLVKSADERAYGTIMSLSELDLECLYGEPSVEDYLPETIVATTFENEAIEVLVYNLPVEKLTGQNKKYAMSLATVASDCGLPKEYIQIIEAFAR